MVLPFAPCVYISVCYSYQHGFNHTTCQPAHPWNIFCRNMYLVVMMWLSFGVNTWSCFCYLMRIPSPLLISAFVSAILSRKDSKEKKERGRRFLLQYPTELFLDFLGVRGELASRPPVMFWWYIGTFCVHSTSLHFSSLLFSACSF